VSTCPELRPACGARKHRCCWSTQALVSYHHRREYIDLGPLAVQLGLAGHGCLHPAGPPRHGAHHRIWVPLAESPNLRVRGPARAAASASRVEHAGGTVSAYVPACCRLLCPKSNPGPSWQAGLLWPLPCHTGHRPDLALCLHLHDCWRVRQRLRRNTGGQRGCTTLLNTLSAESKVFNPAVRRLLVLLRCCPPTACPSVAMAAHPAAAEGVHHIPEQFQLHPQRGSLVSRPLSGAVGQPHLQHLR